MGAAAAPKTTEARLNAPNPAPRTWAGAASDRPARSAGTQAVAARNPASWTTKTRAKAIGMNDTMKSAALMTMHTAGITTRAPRNRCTHRSAMRPPMIVPGMPPRMASAPKVPLAACWVRCSWFS